MILDLKGEHKMEPVIGMLYAMVDENYKRLKSIVANAIKKTAFLAV
jgi:hypothetical protein